jgi:hypothetical protein
LFGPSIGAVFSSKLSSSASAIYAYPSYLAITLTLINIIFVAKFYKESLPKEKRVRCEALKLILDGTIFDCFI